MFSSLTRNLNVIHFQGMDRRDMAAEPTLQKTLYNTQDSMPHNNQHGNQSRVQAHITLKSVI